MNDAANKRFLSPEETAMFCEQVALLLKSGIPLRDGVEALCDNYRDTRYRGVFSALDRSVKETGSLHRAVADAGVFPPYLSHMVKIGEAAGKLDDVMAALSAHYAREAKIRASVRGAITYPIVLVLMMAVVVGVLVTRVLPIFERVFRNLGTQMSAPMTAVMRFGVITGRAVLWVIAAVLLLLLLGFLLSRAGKRRDMARLLGRLFPPVRRVMEMTSSGRFASVLSMMMTAGFPIGEAIALTPGVLADERTREKVSRCARAIAEEGVSLPQAIADAGLFEPIYNKMIQVGFYAGQMDHVMGRLADIYEEQIDDGIRRLVSLIEPSLVALLSVVIGGILLSVMLPLSSIMSSIL